MVIPLVVQGGELKYPTYSDWLQVKLNGDYCFFAPLLLLKVMPVQLHALIRSPQHIQTRLELFSHSHPRLVTQGWKGSLRTDSEGFWRGHRPRLPAASHALREKHGRQPVAGWALTNTSVGVLHQPYVRNRNSLTLAATYNTNQHASAHSDCTAQTLEYFHEYHAALQNSSK